MDLSLGFSPCPNDTFIFDALVNGKLGHQKLDFKPSLNDVGALNRMADSQVLDVTKLSFHAWAYLQDKYQLLTSGAALGRACGPLLISKSPIEEIENHISSLSIAIPGPKTTANFLLDHAFPAVGKKETMLFHEIEEAVLNEKVDLGLIIHENRFTYKQKGLHKIIDLGEHWENATGSPIPLGGIAIRRDLPTNIKNEVNELVRKSVAFAFDNPAESEGYVAIHSQEMDPEVCKAHIELYVNEYSLDLGDKGKEAIHTLLKVGNDLGLWNSSENSIFVEG